MDYKISSMGNTMHHLHERGMFLHDLSQDTLESQNPICTKIDELGS